MVNRGHDVLDVGGGRDLGSAEHRAGIGPRGLNCKRRGGAAYSACSGT